MIHEVEGDILLSGADAIAHGVGPDDDFKQGLALALRRRWPAMYKDFRHFNKVSRPKPGAAWAWGGVGGTRIVALFTQDPPAEKGEHPEPAQAQYVNRALRALRKLIQAEGFTSVALPRIATGVGGLDWDEDVKPHVEHQLGDLGVPIYVYTRYTPGMPGRER